MWPDGRFLLKYGLKARPDGCFRAGTHNEGVLPSINHRSDIKKKRIPKN